MSLRTVRLRLAGMAVVTLTLLAALAPAAPARAQAGPLELRLRLNKGEVYLQTVVNEQRITQTFNGRPVSIDQKMTFGYRMEVLDATDEAANVKATYDLVRMDQKGPTGTFNFDSGVPATQPASPQAAPLKALVGASFTYRIAPSGKVLGVQGIDEIQRKMLESLPADENRAAAEAMMRRQFSNESMKQMLEQATAIYPDKPVNVGDSWEKPLKVAGMFPMLIDGKWTLKSRENGVAVVAVASAIKSDPDAAAMQMGGMNVSFTDLKGEQAGTMRIDEKTGWPLGAETRQRFTATIELAPPDPAEAPVTMPMTIDGTMRLDGKKQ